MAAKDEGFVAALPNLTRALTPRAVRRIERELEDRLQQIPTRLNEYGYDNAGFHVDFTKKAVIPLVLLYRYYFRVETSGIGRVPEGRVLLIGNHAGQLPFDGAMLYSAMLLEARPPRVCRPMGEYLIPRVPWYNVWVARGGAMVGTPANCVTMLERGECVMVFPEGVRGINKPFRERYRLQRFGQGFMRLALRTQTPIVPVALIGSEEQHPGLANLSTVGRRLFGVESFPITPTFPWLGPLGLLPLPVKYRFFFGHPLSFEGDPDDEDAVIEEKVGTVKQEIEQMFELGLRERRGIFR